MSNSKSISFENREKYIALGLNIAFYRRQAGLTQEDLAERTDISRSHLSACLLYTSPQEKFWR